MTHDEKIEFSIIIILSICKKIRIKIWLITWLSIHEIHELTFCINLVLDIYFVCKTANFRFPCILFARNWEIVQTTYKTITLSGVYRDRSMWDRQSLEKEHHTSFKYPYKTAGQCTKENSFKGKGGYAICTVYCSLQWIFFYFETSLFLKNLYTILYTLKSTIKPSMANFNFYSIKWGG